MRELDVKKNTCCHCQTLFTPAFRHPHQTCCGKIKCVLKGRSKLQKKKMEEDIHYRQNQKLSNEKWLEKNPKYWIKYRARNPDKVLKNRMMQQIRNQKRANNSPPSAKLNLDELVVKMHLVEPTKHKQQISFWLLSPTAEITPIKVILISKSVKYGQQSDKRLQPMQVDNRKTIAINKPIPDV